jgi:hypothetical protein
MTVYDSDWYRDHVAKAERQNREHVARYDRSFNAIMAEEMAKADDDDDHDAGDRHDRVPVVDHHASTIANLLVEAGSFPHRAAALHHVLHSATGQALLARMRKAADQPAKESTMSTDSLESILKDFGPVRLCKTIVERQRSPVGEHELVMSLSQHVGGDVAFSKLYASEESVRRAVAIAKAMPFVADLMPQVTTGVAATHEAVNNTEQSEAYAQLQELGRDKWPTATEAQQFTNAISDPVNAELARKAHRRPTAPVGGAYPFPR